MTDKTCCGACGYPVHATKEMACDWCRQSADRIEALTKEQDELQVVVDKQGALLADAYGADLDWEEVLKQRADHEALRQIKALTEQLAAARQDAKAAEDELEMQEQEACMMENDYLKLEKERDALEAKLAKALEALLWCSGSADFNEGGVAREGWLKVCAPLLKGESHDPL